MIGAAGRMGATVCAAVQGADGLQLVAAVDPGGAGIPVGGPGAPLEISADLGALVDAQVEVAVDFTVPGVAVANAVWCGEHGIHTVIGTTGVDDEAADRLRQVYPGTGPLGCVVAPNFAIGAVLMMRFAELAAPWFETAEIIELHHDAKVDAPSGTAVRTAQMMAAASQEWGEDPTQVEVVAGARGGAGPAGIRIHSVRLKGLVAHQEVILGSGGQTLTLRHDSIDRQSFMPGVILAVRQVPARPGLTIGLEHLLNV